MSFVFNIYIKFNNERHFRRAKDIPETSYVNPETNLMTLELRSFWHDVCCVSIGPHDIDAK